MARRVLIYPAMTTMQMTVWDAIGEAGARTAETAHVATLAAQQTAGTYRQYLETLRDIQQAISRANERLYALESAQRLTKSRRQSRAWDRHDR